MNYYQHKFDHVEDYLHHRPPYLLVERIVALMPTTVVTHKTLSGNEFFFPGHFPGAPIVPGAMLQELTTQSAGVLIAANYNPMRDYDTSDPFHNEYALGVLVRVKHARYKSFVRPGDSLLVTVTLNEHLSGMFDFSAVVSVGEQTIMRNGFQLTNIKSTQLQRSP